MRRSTDEEHQPYSIEAQEIRLDHYIASQPGWLKTKRFTDNASAKNTNRPGLQAALTAARTGRIDVLLVVKVDRFSRRQRDLVAMVEELTELDVAFVSATESFDTSTPAGRAMLQMLGTFAEFEREMITERVIAGMERHAAAGRWFGGIHPYGYTVEKTTGKLVIVGEKAPLVREVFRLYTVNRLGTKAIATTLNTRGLRTRTGGPWSAHTISGILTNRVYLGELTFRESTVTGAHPPLVDEATFNEAQRLMDARGEAHSRRASNPSEYHVTGRIRCPKCDKAMIGTAAKGRTKTYRYYTCWTRNRYGTASCDQGRLNADALDQAIFDTLADFYTDHHQLIADAITAANRDHTAGIADRRAELATVEKELTRAQAAIDRYLTAFEDGQLDPDTLKPRLNRLTAKVTQLTGHRDDLATELAQTPSAPTTAALDELADHIADVLDAGTPAQRKALIEQLVAQVKITGPDRIVPVLRIPQPTTNDNHTEPSPQATTHATTVRAMGGLVGDTGIEPVTSSV